MSRSSASHTDEYQSWQKGMPAKDGSGEVVDKFLSSSTFSPDVEYQTDDVESSIARLNLGDVPVALLF